MVDRIHIQFDSSELLNGQNLYVYVCRSLKTLSFLFFAVVLLWPFGVSCMGGYSVSWICVENFRSNDCPFCWGFHLIYGYLYVYVCVSISHTHTKNKPNLCYAWIVDPAFSMCMWYLCWLSQLDIFVSFGCEQSNTPSKREIKANPASSTHRHTHTQSIHRHTTYEWW